MEPAGSAMSTAYQPGVGVFGDCRWRVTSPGTVVIDMSGEVDVLLIPSFARCLDEVIAAGHRRVVLDMGEVEFIDSAGLSAIVRAYKRMARHHGSLRMRGPSPRIRRVLDMVGLTTVVPLEEAVPGA